MTACLCCPGSGTNHPTRFSPCTARSALVPKVIPRMPPQSRPSQRTRRRKCFPYAEKTPAASRPLSASGYILHRKFPESNARPKSPPPKPPATGLCGELSFQKQSFPDYTQSVSPHSTRFLQHMRMGSHHQIRPGIDHLPAHCSLILLRPFLSLYSPMDTHHHKNHSPASVWRFLNSTVMS